jgi:hypothetical protein
VDWNAFDYAAAALLLGSAGLAYWLFSTRVDARHRPVVAIAVVAALLVVWAELAVGVFGTPIAGS